MIKVDQKIRRDERFPLGLNGWPFLLVIKCRHPFYPKDWRKLPNYVRCERKVYFEGSEGRRIEIQAVQGKEKGSGPKQDPVHCDPRREDNQIPAPRHWHQRHHQAGPAERGNRGVREVRTRQPGLLRGWKQHRPRRHHHAHWNAPGKLQHCPHQGCQPKVHTLFSFILY